jgi:hypothetical protein
MLVFVTTTIIFAVAPMKRSFYALKVEGKSKKSDYIR